MFLFLSLASLLLSGFGWVLPFETPQFSHRTEHDTEARSLSRVESGFSFHQSTGQTLYCDSFAPRGIEISFKSFLKAESFAPSPTSRPIWGWVKKQATKISKGAKKIWSTVKSNAANIVDPFQTRRILKKISDAVLDEVNVLWREWRYDRLIEEPNLLKPFKSTDGYVGSPIIFVNGVATGEDAAVLV